jgi:dihydrofolate synthase/folylpolyglutamate synthase
MILNTRRFTVSREALRAGLADLMVPGRYQILSRNPLIIFDPAHNPEAIHELVRTLQEQYPGKKFIAVLSFMRDKEYRRMIQIIQESLTQDILYYELFDPRALPGKTIQQESGTGIPVTASPEDLQRHFSNAGEKNSVVIATGSFRLYSAVKNAAEAAGNMREAGDTTAKR